MYRVSVNDLDEFNVTLLGTNVRYNSKISRTKKIVSVTHLVCSTDGVTFVEVTIWPTGFKKRVFRTLDIRGTKSG